MCYSCGKEDGEQQVTIGSANHIHRKIISNTGDTVFSVYVRLIDNIFHINASGYEISIDASLTGKECTAPELEGFV